MFLDQISRFATVKTTLREAQGRWGECGGLPTFWPIESFFFVYQRTAAIARRAPKTTKINSSKLLTQSINQQIPIKEVQQNKKPLPSALINFRTEPPPSLEKNYQNLLMPMPSSLCNVPKEQKISVPSSTNLRKTNTIHTSENSKFLLLPISTI